MQIVSIPGHIVLGATLVLANLMAAPSAIGTASAYGSITVDGSRITGNATLFNGAEIETGRATTDLRLDGGARLRLGADSRGRIFGDRLVLERGATEVNVARTFLLQAGKFEIVPAAANSRGTVAIEGDNRVEVSTLQGELKVKAGNLLLARVLPGRSLTFEGQPAGAAAPMTITGTVSREQGRYFLMVPETGLKYELTGKDFSKMAGKKVTVVGTPDPAAAPQLGATSVVVASNVTVLGGSSAVAGGAAAGMALGTKVVIAGVAIGAGVGLGFGVHAAVANDSPSR
jgi:hypothetical protein